MAASSVMARGERFNQLRRSLGLALSVFAWTLLGLVWAPGTAQAQVETTTTTEVTGTVDSAQATIQRVTYGLIVVGVLLLLLAVFYWWKTRPHAPRSENVYRRDE